MSASRLVAVTPNASHRRSHPSAEEVSDDTPDTSFGTRSYSDVRKSPAEPARSRDSPKGVFRTVKSRTIRAHSDRRTDVPTD